MTTSTVQTPAILKDGMTTMTTMSTPSTSSSSSSSASSTPTTSTVLATADSLAKCTVKPLRSILKRADSPVLIPKKKVTFIFTTATGAEIENNEIPTASMDWPLNLPNIFGTESGSASYANVLEYDPYTSFTLKGAKEKGQGTKILEKSYLAKSQMVRIPRTATDPAPGVGLGLGLGSVLEDSVKSLSKGLIGWFNEREVPDLMDDSDYRIIVKKRLFGKPTYSLRYGRA